MPQAPGVYRFVGEGGVVVYIGRAKNLRRRLSQYRNAKAVKKHAKMRRIVRAAARLEWDVKATHLDACLDEVRCIQTLRPEHNVASAYSFLYPLIGLAARDGLALFCYTTTPEPFAHYELHGAFRSRELSGAAFFGLMRLLHYIGHQAPRRALHGDGDHRYAYAFAFRQLPAAWLAQWGAFFRGESPAALAELVTALLERSAARRRKAEVQADLDALKAFWAGEALPLRAARERTGTAAFPVPQAERDLLFLRAKDLDIAK